MTVCLKQAIRWWSLSLLVILLPACKAPVEERPPVLHIDKPLVPDGFRVVGTLECSAPYKKYFIRITGTEDKDAGSVEITRAGVPLFGLTSRSFYLGGLGHEDMRGTTHIPVGRDVTGDGRPNLVIGEVTGGRLYRIHLFEIGVSFFRIAVIDCGFSDKSHFADLDGDGVLEFFTNDWSFAGWKKMKISEPEVILCYDRGSYLPARKFMKKNKPEVEDLVFLARKINSVPEEERRTALTEEMLRLAYSGNMKSAWALFEKAGLEPASFLRDFSLQLATSPYWRELQLLSDLAPTPLLDASGRE